MAVHVLLGIRGECYLSRDYTGMGPSGGRKVKQSLWC